jgi:hypothetical protein
MRRYLLSLIACITLLGVPPAGATTFTINNLSTTDAFGFAASVSGTFDYSAGVYSNIDILVTIPSFPDERFNDGSSVSLETPNVLDVLNYKYDPVYQEIDFNRINLNFANPLDNYTCGGCGGTDPILSGYAGAFTGSNHIMERCIFSLEEMCPEGPWLLPSPNPRHGRCC